MKHHMLAMLASAAVPLAFNNEVCETMLVNVKGNDNGPVRINAADFNDELHSKVSKKVAAAAPPALPEGTNTVVGGMPVNPAVPVPPAPSAPPVQPGAPTAPVPPIVPAANSVAVTKQGKKFIAVTPDGKPLERDGFTQGPDGKGFETEAAAWAAIMELPR